MTRTTRPLTPPRRLEYRHHAARAGMTALSSGASVRRLRAVLAAIALSLGTVSCLAQAASAPKGREALIPPETPPPAVDWDGTTDFGALRGLWGHRVDYDQRCHWTDALLASNQAAEFGHRQQAYDITRQFLERCPVSANAQYWAALWAKGLGHPGEVALHRRWYEGLMRSILASGDGRSVATAWVTVHGEENSQLITYLNLERLRLDHLVNMPDGGFVDVVAVTPKGGGPQQLLYFREHLFFVRLQAHIAAQPPEDIAPSLTPAQRAPDEP